MKCLEKNITNAAEISALRNRAEAEGYGLYAGVYTDGRRFGWADGVHFELAKRPEAAVTVDGKLFAATKNYNGSMAYNNQTKEPAPKPETAAANAQSETADDDMDFHLRGSAKRGQYNELKEAYEKSKQRIATLEKELADAKAEKEETKTEAQAVMHEEVERRVILRRETDLSAEQAQALVAEIERLEDILKNPLHIQTYYAETFNKRITIHMLSGRPDNE